MFSISENSPFIIVKPEGLVTCPELIRSELSLNGFCVDRNDFVKDWPFLARRLYGSGIKKRELEAWLDTVQLLYPNNYSLAEVLTVSHQVLNYKEQFDTLLRAKQDIRKKSDLARKIKITYDNDTDVYFSLVHVPDEQHALTERNIVAEHLYVAR